MVSSIINDVLNTFLISGLDSVSNFGPVVQSIVSLMMLISKRQLNEYVPSTLSNTLLFFVGKM